MGDVEKGDSHENTVNDYGDALTPVSPSDESRPFLNEDLEDAIKLVNSHREESSNIPTRKHGVTPLPKAQLATLCAVRLVDPIMFTQIFPYVNEMMDHLHLTEDRSKTGLYSGLVESSFAVAQLFSIYQWARLSDKIGRKPVVLAGISGIALGTVIMGFSQSLFMVLFARSLAGFFSGNVAVVHSVIAEITDHTNQHTAFPIYGLCWPLGAIIGPLLGGTFSNPADKYPTLFDYPIFRTYPYLLPSLVAASIAISGVIFGIFFFKETLPAKQRRRNDSISSPSSPTFDNIPEKSPQSYGVKDLLAIPVIRALCISGMALSGINTAFDVIFVLYCYSPILTGGLAFTAAEIGLALATSGAISAGLQLFFMPYLLRRFDHAKMYNTCMGIWPYTYALLPGLNVIARWGAVVGKVPLPIAGDGVEGLNVGGVSAIVGVTPGTKALLWVGIGVLLCMARVACLGFSVSMILVKDSAPHAAVLGKTNGLAQFAMCFARAFAPACASTLFAFSVSLPFWPLRYLWVFVMVGIAILGTTPSKKIAAGMKHAHAQRQ
ncbi:MFS general substrate transporter [Irpex rosettiformis]|uniref:MFS general substrate transporter n=1 Tax=Irpex rosettiformis TaxID=378272 RepID=A0ACB8UI14_9APHY|nr:MFS general substrate transporter [Irpex rosettiformis]